MAVKSLSKFIFHPTLPGGPLRGLCASVFPKLRSLCTAVQVAGAPRAGHCLLPSEVLSGADGGTHSYQAPLSTPMLTCKKLGVFMGDPVPRGLTQATSLLCSSLPAAHSTEAFLKPACPTSPGHLASLSSSAGIQGLPCFAPGHVSPLLTFPAPHVPLPPHLSPLTHLLCSDTTSFRKSPLCPYSMFDASPNPNPNPNFNPNPKPVLLPRSQVPSPCTALPAPSVICTPAVASRGPHVEEAPNRYLMT